MANEYCNREGIPVTTRGRVRKTRSRPCETRSRMHGPRSDMRDTRSRARETHTSQFIVNSRSIDD